MVEDMGDHFPIIQQDPTSLAFPLDSQRGKADSGQCILDMGSDGLNLPIRITAANHKVIGERGKVLYGQDD